jgi:hypothetical protein
MTERFVAVTEGPVNVTRRSSARDKGLVTVTEGLVTVTEGLVTVTEGLVNVTRRLAVERRRPPAPTSLFRRGPGGTTRRG